MKTQTLEVTAEMPISPLQTLYFRVVVPFIYLFVLWIKSVHTVDPATVGKKEYPFMNFFSQFPIVPHV